MKQVIFNRLAERELTDAMAYYEKKSLGLGHELLEEVRHGVIFLGRHPLAASRVRRDIRRLILPKFPYSLFYRPLKNGTIRILAIAHHKRKPQYWVERK